jgi:hypothetical protein
MQIAIGHGKRTEAGVPCNRSCPFTVIVFKLTIGYCQTARANTSRSVDTASTVVSGNRINIIGLAKAVLGKAMV